MRFARSGALVLVALAIALVAGCGGTSGNGDADPAMVAPKSSAVYAVATISPDGDQRDAVNSVARKLFGESNPGRAISQSLQRAIKRSRSAGDLDYDKDIKPWLGRRAAVAVTQGQSAGGRITGAVMIASKDLDTTRAAISKLERGQRLSKGSYRGVSYDVDRSDQSTVGVVGDFLVLGFRTDGFRAVVDASKDGGLVDTPSFQVAKHRGEGKLALAYLDVKGFVGAALQRLPAEQRSAVQGALGGAGAKPAIATLDAKENQVSFELVAPAGNRRAGGSPAGAGAVIGGLPGDSWAAFGIPRVGQALTSSLRTFQSGLGGAAIGPIRTELRRRTGLDLERDILAALGDVAFFARGTSLLTVGGGAVIKSQDPAAARRLVSRVGALIARQGAAARVRVSSTQIGGASGVKITSARVPGAVNLVAKGDRLVLAYSDPATTEALSPSTKLSESTTYRRAAATLGGISPSLFVDFAPVLTFVDAVTANRSDASVTRARQVLQGLDTLALGSRAEGDQQLVRFVLRLK